MQNQRIIFILYFILVFLLFFALSHVLIFAPPASSPLIRPLCARFERSAMRVPPLLLLALLVTTTAGKCPWYVCFWNGFGAIEEVYRKVR